MVYSDDEPDEPDMEEAVDPLEDADAGDDPFGSDGTGTESSAESSVDDASDSGSEHADEPDEAPAKKPAGADNRRIGMAARYWGTASGHTPRERNTYVVPPEHFHTCAAISLFEYSQVVSSRAGELGRAGDHQGCLTPAQLQTLPPGNRTHAIAVAEILYGCCPYSIRREVGFAQNFPGSADNDARVVEILPVNDLVVPFAPVWPDPESV